MRNRSLFFIFIILIVPVFILVGCKEKDGSGYLFKYSLSDDPKNLDPQLATDENAMAVMANLYSGLMKSSENGNIKPSVAKSYTISDDGLKYTFTLREDNYWASYDSDFKVQVTAKDFVFAFQRIFDKPTSSPYSKELMCIKNSQQVLDGTVDKSQLGVYADGDFTLTIELSESNSDFLSLLTLPATSPCNEDFFYQTKGKYGLDSDFIIANGPFYAKEWEYDPYGKNNHLILRKNKNYSLEETIYPSSLNFFIQKDSTQLYKDFTNGSTDCVVANGTEKDALKGGYLYNEFEVSSYGFIFGSNSKYFNNVMLREGLGLCIDKTQYADKIPVNLSSSNAIIPGGITLLNKSYRELVSENSKAYYDLDSANVSWKTGLNALNIGSVDGVKILIPESFTQYDFIKNITQQWQNKLNFYCGLEVVSDKEYQSRISSGDYDIALYELTSTFNNPRSFLSQFSTGDKNNVFNYSNPTVDTLLHDSIHSNNLNQSVECFSNIESKIVSDYVYIPLFYKKEYLLYDKDISDISYNPFTNQIFFINAKNFD